MTCGTNLSGIGKAMLLYSNDYEDELPRSGGRNTQWGAVANWSAPSRFQAYGLAADGSGGQATVSSCFYLLVKYAEVTPKSFICKGDAGTTEFKLTDLPTATASGFELIDAWDFGGPSPEATKHCSYSYHIPFGLYALTVSSEPGFAVAADRNPWLKSPAADAKTFTLFKPDLTGMGGTSDTAKEGNTIGHQLDGQNVMFLDTHVDFEKRAYCSIEDDNIYTISRYTDKSDALGTMPVYAPALAPMSRKDSVLVHDPDTFGSGGGARPPATRTSSN
jgi:hypothetical protein